LNKSTNYKKLKRLAGSQKTVRLYTTHIDGDAYDGIVLAAFPELILLQVINDFKLGGVIALPTRSLKSVRLGPLEKTMDEIIHENGQIKKLNKSTWIREVNNIGLMLMECWRRKIWPIVEIQYEKKNALYIGPITGIYQKNFGIFCYGAEGKWEKIYKLTYKEVFRVEVFDDYSKHFNRYMAKKLPKKFKAISR
jgi:hypothetical protein